MLNLSDKILIYIHFCLKGENYKFSYCDLKKTLDGASGREYSIKTLRKEFSVLKSLGYIEHKLRYRKPYPVLSTEGRLKISSHLPYKRFGPWDGNWRIVIINIPGKEHKSRVIFQNQLEKLDYKKVSRNTYISPHPLLVSANRIASELGIKQNCLMFESRRLLNQEKIINDIWKADEINESYKQFIAQAKKSFKSKNNLHWVFTAKQLELEFKSIYCEDPHLPTEFLPKDWAGEMAYQRYKTIAQSY